MPKQTTPTSPDPSAGGVRVDVAFNEVTKQVAILLSPPAAQIVFDADGAERLAHGILTMVAQIRAAKPRPAKPAKVVALKRKKR